MARVSGSQEVKVLGLSRGSTEGQWEVEVVGVCGVLCGVVG